ncbi:uncharacterized protein [Periplaneta americana]|uniref:uncharacterized protein n=1 Tax=Periplaneta americana TaxID=6978 RepID=UPI0037E8652B
MAMDEVKMDPLALQLIDDAETKDQKPLFEEGSLSNPELAWVKAERDDRSSHLTSEVKIEEVAVPTSCTLKCEAEADFSGRWQYVTGVPDSDVPFMSQTGVIILAALSWWHDTAGRVESCNVRRSQG